MTRFRGYFCSVCVNSPDTGAAVVRPMSVGGSCHTLPGEVSLRGQAGAHQICWLAEFRNGSAITVVIVFGHEQVYICNYPYGLDRRLGVKPIHDTWMVTMDVFRCHYHIAVALFCLSPIVDHVGHSIVLNTADQLFS